MPSPYGNAKCTLMALLGAGAMRAQSTIANQCRCQSSARFVKPSQTQSTHGAFAAIGVRRSHPMAVCTMILVVTCGWCHGSQRSDTAVDVAQHRGIGICGCARSAGQQICVAATVGCPMMHRHAWMCTDTRASEASARNMSRAREHGRVDECDAASSCPPT